MDMNIILQYVYDSFVKEGILIIVACYIIGNIITKCMPKLDNNYTVPILTLIGALLVLPLGIYKDQVLVARLIRGMFLGWSSTGIHELCKALVKLGYIKLPGYNTDK